VIGAAGEVRNVPVSYRVSYGFKGGFNVLMHDFVFEANDLDAESFQECRPFCLVFDLELLKMWRTIELDGNLAVDAEKVDDIATYAVLPGEFLAEDLSSSEMVPESGFCGCGIVSEFFTTGFEGWNVDEIAVFFRDSWRVHCMICASV
jgi:hypothetical protein